MLLPLHGNTCKACVRVGLEHQRHKRAASCGLLCTMPIGTPFARKGCDPLVGPIIAELEQVLMHQLDVAPLFARLPRLGQKPCRQTIRVRIQLAWTRRRLKLWLYRVLTKILFDGVARQTRTSGNLSYRHFATQCPASNDTQKSHVDHSMSP